MIPAGHKVVGEIVGAFGIKGAMKVEPRTDFPERFAKGALLFLQGQPRRVLETSWHQGQARVRVEGIVTPEEARTFAGQLLTVPSSEAPRLEKDQYLTEDLIGCRLHDSRHGEIGEVETVERGVVCDFLKVGGLLIPARKEFVNRVDLESRVIHVTLIEGMKEEI